MSVVIPTYNRARTVIRAIDSVLHQTHPALEIIVVDDGSTDETRGLVASRYADEPRVIYLYQENRGVSAARNRGLEAVSGSYVCLLDSDDTWEPWKVELQLACFDALHEVGMVWTDLRAVDPDDRVLHERYLREMYHGYKRVSAEELLPSSLPLVEVAPSLAHVVGQARVRWGDIYSQMVISSFVHTSTVMLRAERARAVGKFDVELLISGEDHDFHLRTCREGPVALADVPAICYRVGAEDQLTRPEYTIHLARNYLRTMSKAFAENGENIRLPKSEVNAAFGRAHAWIGECLYALGQIAEARSQFWKSVRRAPTKARSWGLLLLTSTPRSMMPAMRGMLRAVAALLGLGE